MALLAALLLQADVEEFLKDLRRSPTAERLEEADRRLSGVLPIHERQVLLMIAFMERRRLRQPEAADRLLRDLRRCEAEAAKPWRDWVRERGAAGDEKGLIATVAEGEAFARYRHPLIARIELTREGYDAMIEAREKAGDWKGALAAFDARDVALRAIPRKDIPPYGCGLGYDADFFRKTRCRFEAGEVERALEDFWRLASQVHTPRAHFLAEFIDFERRSGRASTLDRRQAGSPGMSASVFDLCRAYRDRDPAAFGRICATMNSIENAADLELAGMFLSRMSEIALPWLKKGVLADDPAATMLSGWTRLKALAPVLEGRKALSRDLVHRTRIERALASLSSR